MTSLFRPLLASLLCGMIVLGHAPAWLHVANCDSESHSHAAVPKTESVSVCSHACHHHATEPEADETVSHSHDSSAPHQHDSDTCVICQSLASPTGVTWELVVALPAEFVSEPAFVSLDRPLLAIFLSIPLPRGPPVIVA